MWSYFDYLVYGRDPDIQKEEMDKSESKSKFVRGQCWRETFMIYAEDNDSDTDTDDSVTFFCISCLG